MTISGIMYDHVRLADPTKLAEVRSAGGIRMCADSHDERALDLLSNPPSSAQRADLTARIASCSRYISEIEADPVKRLDHAIWLPGNRDLVTRMRNALGEAPAPKMSCAIL